MFLDLTVSVYFFISVACPSVDDGEKQHKRFRLSSKSSPKENLHPTTLPLVEQDTSNYREKFIPPELSIWDYFIAKVTFFFTLEFGRQSSVGTGDLPYFQQRSVLEKMVAWEEWILWHYTSLRTLPKIHPPQAPPPKLQEFPNPELETIFLNYFP